MSREYPFWFTNEPVLARRLFELGVPAGPFLDACDYLAISPVEQRRVMLRLGVDELMDVIHHAEFLKRTFSEKGC